MRSGHADGRRRFWVSLPPGAGKTIVGTELVAGLEQPAVVLCPNTAIQAQWIRTWDAYGRGPAGADRSLAGDVTVLTYQSMASFDREDSEEGDSLVDQLHDNGRVLVEALRAAGPVTIVLDECHHLLEVWGALLAEILDEVPEATVLGLTATPPTVLERRQAAQVQSLFGDIVYTASIPAAVREGDLAPFAELAWLVRPTSEEQAWLAQAASRFLDLSTDLLDPTYGSTPILVWFDQRFGTLPLPWTTFEREEPELARAALRLVHADLLALPDGARLREQHRQELVADDWAALVDDWVKRCLAPSDDPRDDAVIEDLRQAMPGIGFHLTRRGVSSRVSALDRVLSRSAAKMAGAAHVVGAEHRALGERLRSVVVCDHERAPATSSAALRDAPTLYGSAVQVMVALLDVPVRSVLVTGRTVAATPAVAADLVDRVRRQDPHLDLRLEPFPDLPELVQVVGGWSSRQWVPHVTSFFERGHAQVLVGTRALLGEGWDARGVNSLVDLSVATTTAAVVQTRGRALRADPAWQDKVAFTWSVVCVAEDHPGGDSDWKRFVRKHDGYFGVDDDGEVISGVAHVDARFSPFAPPAADVFDAHNLDMLERTHDRAGVRERWRVGEPYEDDVRHTLRVWARESASAGGQSAVGADAGAPEPPTARMGPTGAVSTDPRRDARRHPWRSAGSSAVDLGLAGYAWALADAMAARDLGGAGASAVRAHVGVDGEYRLHLDGVDEATSLRFVEALEELLSPVVSPSHLVAQHLAPPAGAGQGWAVLLGRHRPVGRWWFPVPGLLARRAADRAALAAAWARWVSAADVVAVRSPEGEAALASCHGTAALDASTTVRAAWR